MLYLLSFVLISYLLSFVLISAFQRRRLPRQVHRRALAVAATRKGRNDDRLRPHFGQV